MVGNAGAGKSLLANILLKKNRFISKFQAKQVTTVFDEDSIVEKGKELVIIDVPGLLDTDPEVEERNIKQLQEAFKQHNKQIVMFVFNVNGGGRITPTDLSTFVLLFEAYKFNQQSVIFVVSGVSNEVYSDKEKLRDYESECDDIISGYMFRHFVWSNETVNNMVLVPKFDNFKDGEFSHDSVQAVSVRKNLTEAINESVYHGHIQSKPIDLSANAMEKRIREIKAIIADLGRIQIEQEFFGKIISHVFYPAIEYGKSWGESFQTDEYSTWSVKDKTDALINRMCAQNAVAAFTTGLLGQASAVLSVGLTAPMVITGQMIASVTATASLQVALGSAVATIYGKDPHNPITQFQIIAIMLGGGFAEVLKQGYGAAGVKQLQQMLRANIITGANIKWLNSMIYKLMPSLGRHLFVIQGAKIGLVRVADFLPLIGPLFNGLLDGGLCLAHAKGMDFALFLGDDGLRAKRWFNVEL
eukprot:gene7907-8723_t